MYVLGSERGAGGRPYDAALNLSFICASSGVPFHSLIIDPTVIIKTFDNQTVTVP